MVSIDVTFQINTVFASSTASKGYLGSIQEHAKVLEVRESILSITKLSKIRIFFIIEILGNNVQLL
ncbi:MAG: hypothetical protein LBQ59_03500 [Candidatus Peribacteria bacterium]|nr:hypothetical protein [Candidatus Peribacteria bacterium]